MNKQNRKPNAPEFPGDPFEYEDESASGGGGEFPPYWAPNEENCPQSFVAKLIGLDEGGARGFSSYVFELCQDELTGYKGGGKNKEEVTIEKGDRFTVTADYSGLKLQKYIDIEFNHPIKITVLGKQEFKGSNGRTRAAWTWKVSLTKEGMKALKDLPLKPQEKAPF